MIFLVKVISVLLMALGILFVVKPELIKKVLAFFQEGKRLYLAGTVRVVIGGVLLFAAAEARVIGAMVILGLLFVTAGILIFVVGPEKLKILLKWWEEMPLWVCRIIGLFPVFFGALILYLA